MFVGKIYNVCVLNLHLSLSRPPLSLSQNLHFLMVMNVHHPDQRISWFFNLTHPNIKTQAWAVKAKLPYFKTPGLHGKKQQMIEQKPANSFY